MRSHWVVYFGGRFIRSYRSLPSSCASSVDLEILGVPGRQGWSNDLAVSTICLDLQGTLPAHIGIGVMDTSSNLWPLAPEVDESWDTSSMSPPPMPFRLKSAPLQREPLPPGPSLASLFQVSDLHFRPLTSTGCSGQSSAQRHSGIPRVSDLPSGFPFIHLNCYA